MTVAVGCWSYQRSAVGKSGKISSVDADPAGRGRTVNSLNDCKSPDFIKYRIDVTGLDFNLFNSQSGLIIDGEYFSSGNLNVSQYDDLIKEFSDSINWDWRLLASLIWQESRFRPDIVSLRGAYGLMQIMPVTARNFGIDIKFSPENNMRAGTMYINWLYSIFDTRIPNEQERIYFVLAAYNAGPGHVLDAMRLAEKYGMDPHKWEGNVAVWLLKKSEPKYYKDSVVKSGYFRGKESVKFVSQVLDRFELYKNIIPVERTFLF